jgi:acyl-CoA thioester hydrolase
MPTEFRITVRSTDLDGLRHVNNAVFFQYFEQARLEHLRRAGYVPTYARGEGPRHTLAIAETSCRYRAPAYYGDVLLVRVRTREVRQRSFTLTYEVRREADGALLAEGESAQVWLDDRDRPAPLPDDIRAGLERSREG